MNDFNMKKDNRGVAMMVCITIIAILMIFCFSLLAVSYNLYSSQNNAMQADKNAEAAKSLSMAIREELTAEKEDSESYLCKYLRYNIVAGHDVSANAVNGGTEDTWPYYDPEAQEESGHDKKAARRYFKLHKSDSASINGFPSNTELCIWWTQKAPEDEYEAEKIHLFVEVECRSGSQSYVICSEYELLEYELKDGKKSVFPAVSGQTKGVNHAGNRINTNYVWKWKYIGCE